MKNFKLSAEHYETIHNEFNTLLNKEGHPYALISVIQLLEILKTTGKNEQIVSYALDDYDKLIKGFWKINISSFYFFKSELKNQLMNVAKSSSDSNMINQISDLVNRSSSYHNKLQFVEFLNNNAVDKIKQTLLAGGFDGNLGNKRLVINDGSIKSLISIKELRSSSSNGKRWNYKKRSC